jgi:aryl-alcohol dehydrogenase-like predicted oxidoreductase
MKYGSVPGVEKKVSRIAQGCMMLKEADGQEWTDSLLDAAFAAGINTFDHSYVYGGGVCERAFGQWLKKRGRRDDVVILDKGCHPQAGVARVTPELVESDINESLERLGVDFIDLWLFHRDDPTQPVGPLVDSLNRMIADGKIGAFGGSNWTKERIEEVDEYADKCGLASFAASSPNFSLADQIDSPWGPDCITISGPANQGVRDWYAEKGIAVFTWSSLARGFLSGRISRANFDEVKDQFEEHTIRCYVCDENWERLDRVETLAAEKGLNVPQLALAYVLNQPMNVFALVGAVLPDEINANLAALDTELSVSEMEWLDLKRESR